MTAILTLLALANAHTGDGPCDLPSQVIRIPVAWGDSAGELELSGLDRLGDWVLALPQGENVPMSIAALPTTDVTSVLNTHRGIVDPLWIHLEYEIPSRMEIGSQVATFDGFEALSAKEAGLTLVSEWTIKEEDQPGKNPTMGWCVHEAETVWAPLPRAIRVGAAASCQVSEARVKKKGPPPKNAAMEAIVPTAQGHLVLPEVAGAIDSGAVGIGGQNTLSTEGLKWRITDATRVVDGRFWVINVLWHGDYEDYVAGVYANESCEPKKGKNSCERLAELEIRSGAMVATGRSVVMHDVDRKDMWNLEGVARFSHGGQEGLLVVNDEYAGASCDGAQAHESVLLWVPLDG